MKLNRLGEIAHEEWKATEKIRTNYIIHEFIIRNEIAYCNISIYIQNNPSKWKGDKFNKKQET